MITLRTAAAFLAATAAACAATVLGAGAAGAAPSAQDTTFLKGNEQVNLAEQAIGAIAEQRASKSQTKSLAATTISDHKKAQGKATAVAKAENVTLPSAPNATQQAQASQLKTVAVGSFDLTYAQIQVAGHQQSIAATQQEIAAGQDAKVIAWAKAYLPVAQMHLQMAQSLLTALGGNPGGAGAGTGGQAATGASSNVAWRFGLGGGVLLATAGAALLLRRRAATR